MIYAHHDRKQEYKAVPQLTKNELKEHVIFGNHPPMNAMGLMPFACSCHRRCTEERTISTRLVSRSVATTMLFNTFSDSWLLLVYTCKKLSSPGHFDYRGGVQGQVPTSQGRQQRSVKQAAYCSTSIVRRYKVWQDEIEPK